MNNLDKEFLNDENCILVIPTTSKPVKIVFEDSCKVEATDNPMEFVLSKKISLKEMAANMGINVDELIELMRKSL